MDSISLPIVHPSFERLKRSGRGLHFIAGLLIISHAFGTANQQALSPVYFWCQMIIALDIFILVFAGKNMLLQLPKLNLFFRLAEAIFFIGIAIVMLSMGKWGTSVIYSGLSIGFFYLFYCERKVASQEWLSIYHTGISVPGIPENRFFYWSNINQIEAHYHTIHVETSFHRNFDFDLRKNLSFEELEQIHEFCRHYLTIDRAIITA
jgi:hypothetical protein